MACVVTELAPTRFVIPGRVARIDWGDFDARAPKKLSFTRAPLPDHCDEPLCEEDAIAQCNRARFRDPITGEWVFCVRGLCARHHSRNHRGFTRCSRCTALEKGEQTQAQAWPDTEEAW
jgi:hypothetical protein